jgi:hypothetical protein
MDEKGWEFASFKFIKGSRGGLYLTYFLPFNSPLRQRLGLTDNQEVESTGLGMALAQLGRDGWDLVSKASHEFYFLKRVILAERPIDRPLLVGFEVKTVAESSDATKSEMVSKVGADNDSDPRLAVARMGIAIG